MKVEITVTRVFEMDEKRILSESEFKPPDPSASMEEKQRWLVESFWELCGFDRDHDHLDGNYVWLDGEHGETDFDWPEELSHPRLITRHE